MSKFKKSMGPWEHCAYKGLKETLEKTGYNQGTLAQDIGVSQYTVISWIHGDRDTAIQMLLALEDLTGMTFRELFGECEARM